MNATKQTSSPSNTETRSIAKVCIASCKKLAAKIEKAKQRIYSEFRETLAAHEHLLQLALNEAEALAWETPYPHLVFPDLAVEKANAVAAWTGRQSSMLRLQPAYAHAH